MHAAFFGFDLIVFSLIVDTLLACNIFSLLEFGKNFLCGRYLKPFYSRCCTMPFNIVLSQTAIGFLYCADIAFVSWVLFWHWPNSFLWATCSIFIDHYTLVYWEHMPLTAYVSGDLRMSSEGVGTLLFVATVLLTYSLPRSFRSIVYWYSFLSTPTTVCLFDFIDFLQCIPSFLHYYFIACAVPSQLFSMFSQQVLQFPSFYEFSKRHCLNISSSYFLPLDYLYSRYFF